MKEECKQKQQSEMLDMEKQMTGSYCSSANRLPPTGKQLCLPARQCDKKTTHSKNPDQLEHVSSYRHASKVDQQMYVKGLRVIRQWKYNISSVETHQI